MKRLFRSVVSVVVCTLALMPAAWGRSINGLRCTHPVGDDPSIVASANRWNRPVIVFIRIGFFVDIPVVVFPTLPLGDSNRNTTKRQVTSQTAGGRP